MASRLPTLGAVPVVNEKGEVRMQKVKVQRYVSGKKPVFAQERREEQDEEAGHHRMLLKAGADLRQLDRRLQRTAQTTVARGEARVLEEREDEEQEEDEAEDEEIERHAYAARARTAEVVIPEEPEEEEEDEEAIEERRRRLREQALRRRQEEEVMAAAGAAAEEEEEDEEQEDDEEEESEYETDDSVDNIPAFKPVFVSKAQRKTIEERDKKWEEDERLQDEARRRAEERKKETHDLLAEIVLQDLQEEQGGEAAAVDDEDKENDEVEFEAWRVRELLRIKRDREERETRERERLELERLREMPEDEKRAWLEAHPKEVVNQAEKGEYKFMQKYYHRGAFYLDQEETVLKRNVDQPTLEDHFNKASLPKVMQVKNFGKKGRTKYTHLTDQDTTKKDAGWALTSAVNKRFELKRGGVKAAEDVDAPFKRKRNY